MITVIRATQETRKRDKRRCRFLLSIDGWTLHISFKELAHLTIACIRMMRWSWKHHLFTRKDKIWSKYTDAVQWKS